MCLAEATLVYGLTVRSSSLVFAANAWTRLKVTLPFFERVFLRRRLGVLKVDETVEGIGSVSQIPDEVWEEIKIRLVQEEIATSQDQVLAPHLCEKHQKDRLAELSTRITWSSYLSCWDCDDVGEYTDWIMGNICHWQGKDGKKATSLLSDFGLALGSSTGILTTDAQDDYIAERTALALVAAPLGLRKTNFSTAQIDAECGLSYQRDQHTLVDVSFKLPSGIDQRFDCLIRLFDLEIVDSSIDCIVPLSKKVSRERNKAARGRTTGVKDKVTKEIKPRWSLYLACHTQG